MTRHGTFAGGAALLAVVVLAGCDGTGARPGAGAKPAQGSSSGTSPLDNPGGTRPGLGALTTDRERADAREIIEALATKGRGPRTGYDRDEFGYAWLDTADGVPFARNGCDTRIISTVRRATEAFAQLMQGVASCAY